MISQSLKVVLISAFLTALLSIGINFIPSEFVNSSTWFISIIFHVLVSFLLNLVLFKKQTDPKEFVFKVMFTSMGRLLLCMIGIFIYSLVDKPHFLPFAIHFMLHYILFTILEISYLLKHIKTQTPNP